MMVCFLLNATLRAVRAATDSKGYAALFSSGMLAGGLGVNVYFRSPIRLISRKKRRRRLQFCAQYSANASSG
jgi:hypothetical protein